MKHLINRFCFCFAHDTKKKNKPTTHLLWWTITKASIPDIFFPPSKKKKIAGSIALLKRNPTQFCKIPPYHTSRKFIWSFSEGRKHPSFTLRAHFHDFSLLRAPFPCPFLKSRPSRGLLGSAPHGHAPRSSLFRERQRRRELPRKPCARARHIKRRYRDAKLDF